MNQSQSSSNPELARSLKPRHVLMIALGGAIGAGMFKGSSTSIAAAGPGVVVSYLFAGLILLFVMQGLAEMAGRNPQARTFRELIEPILGRFTGYLVGWMYWLTWVLVMAAETAAAAVFLQYWFPDVPLWAMSLLVSLGITSLNLLPVKVFGEAEFWLAGIKIAVLLLFILLGGTLLFTGFADHAAPGLTNLTAHGGFFPTGLTGLVGAMLIVMFSFGGTEMIGMTLGETQNPEKVIPRAARAVITRIVCFYVLPILVIVSLVPWNQLDGNESPFVTVFHAVGIPYVDHLMNFVLLTAVLSATNTGMYAASRMLYTQASDGQAPRFFGKLSERGVPVRAMLASSSFLYLGVIVAFFAKGNTFNYLMVIPGFAIMIVWALLALAHLRSRRSKKETTKETPSGTRGYQVRWFPATSWFALLALIAVFIGATLTAPPAGVLTTLGAVLLIAVTYRFTRKPTL